MGCTSSSPKHSADDEDALAKAATAPISILVTGRAGCGVTSLCRRFVTKGFESPMVGMVGTGMRTVAVNGTNVPVTLIDSNDRERRRDFPHVDGILYPVDAGGDVEEPFAGIFKRINRLYIAEDKRQAFRLQNTLSRGTTGSCDGIDAPHVMLGSMGASRLTEASKAADNEYGVVSVGVGSGAGSKESNDSIGASIGLPRPPTLVVRTERSPKHRGLLDPQEPQQPLKDSIPPLHVVLNKADQLVEAGDRYRVRRVRAMASNWSMANRCNVSFVSAKTGQGLEEALGTLIRDIVWRRHAVATESTTEAVGRV